jgi:hypothetical protein
MFDDKDRASPDHSTMLGILARADAARLSAFAETLLPTLGDVTVIQSCTGLVMLPMRDTVQGTFTWARFWWPRRISAQATGPKAMAWSWAAT